MVNFISFHFPGLLETVKLESTSGDASSAHKANTSLRPNDSYLLSHPLRAASLRQPFKHFGFEVKDISNIFVLVTTAIREIQITRHNPLGLQVILMLCKGPQKWFSTFSYIIMKVNDTPPNTVWGKHRAIPTSFYNFVYLDSFLKLLTYEYGAVTFLSDFPSQHCAQLQVWLMLDFFHFSIDLSLTWQKSLHFLIKVVSFVAM